ncbi:DoxX family protein [Solibacillus silvestris]
MGQKYPQWFRVITGIVELGAAILLVIGFWNVTAAFIGAAILVAVGIGGVITHIRIKDTMKDTAMIGVLGLLAFVLFIILL